MKKIFKPNLTTDLIIKALKKCKIHRKSSFLDLGCGNGIIGREIAKAFNLKKVHGSDISLKAIKKSRQLVKKGGTEYLYKVGDCLEPWKNYKFDIISCDVSGISEDIASISKWYNGVSCKTGNSGLNLVNRILKEIDKFLNKNGVFVIPIISLCNTKILIRNLKKKFKTTKIILSTDWPLEKKILKEIQKKELKSNQNWKIFNKFGISCCNTKIMICKLND